MATNFGTSCVRGCCESTNIRLDVAKREITVDGEIARGSESVVYKGVFEGGMVAIKMPILSTSDDMNRFHKELQILSKLSHKNLAQLKGSRAFPPDYSLIFEYYDGGSLSDAIHEREWRPNSLETVRLALHLARALEYVHSEGIIHRDVKPANILLDAHGTPHLSDFGLSLPVARLASVSAASWHARGGSRQPTGGFHKLHMVGTLRYMAPEVLSRQAPTLASDVFSLAITLNELATGVVPYSDLTTDAKAHTVLEMNYSEQQLASCIVSEQLRPVLLTHTGLTAVGFHRLIQRCWQALPQDRPSMPEVVQALAAMLSQHTAQQEGAGSEHHSGPAAVGQAREESSWADRAREDTGRAGPALNLTHGLPVAEGEAGYRPVVTMASFATCGAREKMEDRHFMLPCLWNQPSVHAFGVFDGHRGYEAAEYAATSVPQLLMASLAASMDPRSALHKAFLDTDAGFQVEVDSERKHKKGGGSDWHPGCTATAAVIWRDRLFVANSGDCRTVLCRSGKPVALSRDHVASDERERERVLSMGGSVQWRVNTWRVGKAGIEVTRSLGDGDLKPAVSAEPEILEHILTDEDEFVVMASDGLWEKVSNEDMVEFVKDTVKEPSMCGKRLATESANRGSKDNITVVVVYLRPVSTVERVY